ncbi:glycosyltransferase, partial [Sphingobacterium siyangense]|uniref:glycosyltransferase n=1 Tax=Sphingobacterium siyangense TaxID=459529 RepID=UPI003C7693B6
LYRGAVSFIFPSFYEGFGLPILEAIKLGTKIVASNIPAFMEFKSNNIIFFEINNVQSFRAALIEAQERSFFSDEEFLNGYSKEHIYKLNDRMFSKIDNLL